MKERLQKILAQASVASSRRAAELLIEQGRVRINGETATLGSKADPDTDLIEVDGTRVRLEAVKKVYIALNKPRHVLTTTTPHRGDKRQTVFGLVKSSEHLFSIGRLDADSEGLVVLTNDGDLAQRLSHPRYRHSKTYKVEVSGLPTQDVLDKWRNGVILDEEGRTAPCVVTLVEGDKKQSTLRIIMTEGKKRQIRRVGMALGHQVRRLTRTHIGMLPLGELRPGEWRELNARDVKLLMTPSPDLKLLRGVHRDRRRLAKGDGIDSHRSVSPRAPREEQADESNGSVRRRSGKMRLVRDEPDETERGQPIRPGRSGISQRSHPESDQDERRPSRRPVRRSSDEATGQGEHPDAGQQRRPARGRKPSAKRPGDSKSRSPKAPKGSGKPGANRSRTPLRRKNGDKKER